MEEAKVPITVVSGERRMDVQVQKGDNLLMALIHAGLPVEFLCTTGKCATCRLRMEIPAGSAEPPGQTERYRLGEAAVRQGYRLACQVYVTGPLVAYL